jgi:succinate dehydrogenase / fumarate reductase, membrane anchor subunit
MAMKSDLGKVRGLGAAKTGTQHWWQQRVTAVANVLLGLWLVASLAAGAASDHATVQAWIGQPLTAVLLSLLVISLFYHIRLGLQVVIEDYVHDHGAKLLAMVGLTFFTVLAAAMALFSILKIALTA